MQTGSVWQVFGTKKCQDTRKAQRFFKERGIRIQEVDLSERGMSPGELKSVAAQSGWPALLDRESARFKARGLSHALLGDKDIEAVKTLLAAGVDIDVRRVPREKPIDLRRLINGAGP